MSQCPYRAAAGPVELDHRRRDELLGLPLPVNDDRFGNLELARQLVLIGPVPVLAEHLYVLLLLLSGASRQDERPDDLQQAHWLRQDRNRCLRARGFGAL